MALVEILVNRVCVLKNPVQDYSWGSRTFIPQLMGEVTPSDQPQAELWMGAHPKAPSLVLYDGEWISLPELVKKNPEDILGRTISKKFSNRFPFLFKVLAAARPLSIQAHPNKEQAHEGFLRENGLKIPLNAPHRNYKDQNHKPELICALTPFLALRGFRNLRDIISLMERIESTVIKKVILNLKSQTPNDGLKRFFTTLMTMERKEKEQVISDVVTFSEKHFDSDPALEWVLKLHNVFPSDPGILSPIFLNMIRLQPGEAMHIPAGELHVYMEGAGIELMANSDNVLRGGLTHKHMDIPELLRILKFTPSEPAILRPEKINQYERVYPTSVEEFRLSEISIGEGLSFYSQKNRAVEIIICMNGEARIKDTGSGETLFLKRGRSIMVPASVKQYRIQGQSKLYKATVPL